MFDVFRARALTSYFRHLTSAIFSLVKFLASMHQEFYKFFTVVVQTGILLIVKVVITMQELYPVKALTSSSSLSLGIVQASLASALASFVGPSQSELRLLGPGVQAPVTGAVRG